jgi:hypothetical protein
MPELGGDCDGHRGLCSKKFLEELNNYELL